MSSQDITGSTQDSRPDAGQESGPGLGSGAGPSKNKAPGQKAGRWALLGSAGFFGLYALNVLSGKIASVTDMQSLINLGDVGEFVTLFAAAICFVVATLRREAAN
ncbi:hypothetical protein [Denitrobaculum tricleocarpae]|uniref:Uncharacterized protein n=1 Tax=Denitrobaculum tricleocarpae TaxID=2591009 RepID=A0A545U333_9PROT|nr:hypothetical protein [Denitrobaculum tricleocarpae]TQV83881.1 hypothetical protein FKG95_04705 [Denitrobaculum tricleocarpae]